MAAIEPFPTLRLDRESKMVDGGSDDIIGALYREESGDWID